ncbi:DinB family protein [Paenibacillus lemnae]|uniref:DinB family protein n=1 Tax=Paenibacillus lemnae TaxID=1330551 RepID=A0A848M8Y3_PAELE|nr:DinB family protein [Paenibacillus lemnae]NMO97066.1 DinB family protein [Paenibacillus lemnae]
MLNKLEKKDYPEYFEKYVELITDSDIVHALKQQLEQTSALFKGLTEDQLLHRYAEGKWAVKEVFGHIMDHERLLSYWLYRFARGDMTPLSGGDRELSVQNARYIERSAASLIEEYAAVRQSTIQLLQGLPEEAWSRNGYAGDQVMSVQALAFIIAGHEKYHINMIEERYLKL